MSGGAVVTGAGSGIGRATALLLGIAGYRVWCLDRDAAAVQRTAEDCSDARWAAVDVRDAAAVRAAVDRAAADRGLDILVTCAGTGPGDPPRDDATWTSIVDDETWTSTLETHVSGTFWCCREALRHMTARGHGAIVTVSSTAGLYGGAAPHYAAAKSAIIGLTKTLAHDVGRYGVRVNAVAPGFADTPMTSSAGAALATMVGERTDLGRLLTADEIAEAIVFLAGSSAAAITGTVVEVSGGLRWMP